MSTSDDEKKAYLERIHAERGYVLEFHKILVAEDLAFMKALNGLQELAHMGQRRLDRKTKELAFVAALVGTGAAKEHIRRHLIWAKEAGATKAEVLELLEMLAAPCGVPRFMLAFEVWCELYAPERVEFEPPSPTGGAPTR